MDGPRIVIIGARVPDIGRAAFVAPGATLIGSVSLGEGSSIWYGAVLRADRETISIGERSNVQDLCVVHADPGFPAVVGDGVSIGHSAVVHGCRIDDEVIIGMGAIVMNGATVGSGSIVAAGALVTEGREIPPGSLVAGVPGRVVRELTEDDRSKIRRNWETYVEMAVVHRSQFDATAPGSRS